MRAWREDSRSNKWNESSQNGFIVKILGFYQSETEAYSAEQLLIQENKGSIINVPIARSKTLDMNFEEFNNYFYIDPNSPSFLSKRKTGKPAGSRGEYWNVRHKCKLYKVHRIVYLLTHKRIDSSLIIDHIDRNRLNNAPENLRQVTREENVKNSSIRKDNRYRIKGISFVTIRGRDYWKAEWYVRRAKHYKSFSCKKLGYEGAKQAAINCRNENCN